MAYSVQQTDNFLFFSKDYGPTRQNDSYTEGVRQIQPRVELWQPWDQVADDEGYPERVGALANPFGVCRIPEHLFPGLPKLNPGLALANTFGVGFCLLSSFWLRLCCAVQPWCPLCLRGEQSPKETSTTNLHQTSCLSARPGSVCLSECLLNAGLLKRGILRRNVR